ncbi:BRO1 domain-containing protein BROX-like isoform X2 [Antedon mediterranea]|uniref:BRO1 domain-containing protein BROX-like isoform X2 n=1 Tax=Antedon mediterranea TaxID=105859 RepID=UPI003AF5DB5B
MAHWFHRNPLKASIVLSFDLGIQATTPLARKICNETRDARAALMQLLPDPGNEVTTIQNATEKYLSLLEGFIVAPQGSSQASSPPPQLEPTPEGEMSMEEGGAMNEPSGGFDGESKLRHAFRIKWSNTLISKLVEQNDLVFEKISILYNVALWYTKHAAKLAGSKQEVEEDEAKEVHRALRTAAGIFKHIEESLVPQLKEEGVAISDLDTRILSAYTLQCTAEAQEVTLARAIELEHSASLISALAHETARLFQKARDSLKSIEDPAVTKWSLYFNLKFAFYLSYAHCYNCKVLLNKEKCGEAIRSVKESDTFYEKCKIVCEEYAKAKGPGTIAKPEQHLFFRRFGPDVKRTLEKVERENSFIFYQKIPEEVPELELKATYGLASPQEYAPTGLNQNWTPQIYDGFHMSANSAPAQTQNDEDEFPGVNLFNNFLNFWGFSDENVTPIKEKDIKPTDKDPKNNSGCVVS